MSVCVNLMYINLTDVHDQLSSDCKHDCMCCGNCSLGWLCVQVMSLSDCIRGRTRFCCACATSYLYLREKGHQQLMSKILNNDSFLQLFMQSLWELLFSMTDLFIAWLLVQQLVSGLLHVVLAMSSVSAVHRIDFLSVLSLKMACFIPQTALWSV